MSLRHWRYRRRRVEQAREALEQSKRERVEVERLTHDLQARGARNNFAPKFDQALRRRTT